MSNRDIIIQQLDTLPDVALENTNDKSLMTV